ncbi:MAG: glycosyltransferase family 4 protein [Magnetococcales bacterium]|nr:glycosyltransferase family 4 protein [Magnetococcales bacterium]
MKISFILGSFPRLPIGGYRVVYEYANHLVARGYDVAIYYCRDVAGMPPPEGIYRKLRTYLGFIYRRLTRPSPDWQALDPRIAIHFIPSPDVRYILDGDVVFATSWAMAETVLAYPASKGQKVYFYQHYETWSGPKEKVDATWRMPLHKLVISRWLLEVGESLGAGEMTLIPDGIDLDLFRVVHPMENRGPVVTMMYSHQTWKGGADGLRALEKVREKIPGLRVLLFGLVKPEVVLPEWATFYENPPQRVLVEEIYNRGAVFLWPSHFEGFSLPPAEAMACGSAVVSTDCGGVLDFAQHGVSALISPPKQPEQLAENTIRLLQDEALRLTLARAGHAGIQALTWAHSTDLMEEFLARITCRTF